MYEWESPNSSDATDSCSSQSADYVAASAGCIYLLSTGKSASASYFVNASSDGSSAFIITSSALVPSDRDASDDVYDVRINGGLASQFAVPPVPCGSSEACRSSFSPATPSANPASETLNGPGNQAGANRHKKHHHKQNHRKRQRHKGHRRKGARHKSERGLGKVGAPNTNRGGGR